MLDFQQNGPLQVICDLRKLDMDVNSDRRLQNVWQQASATLVGKVLEYGKPLEISLPSQGVVSFWSVSPQKALPIGEDTLIEIVDVLRRPALRYRCQICGEYGPLRCTVCEKEKGKADGQERLCTRCAHFIKDRLTAYCPRHVPICQCSDTCQLQADFFCSSCQHWHRRNRHGEALQFYNNHVHHYHPQNPEIDYCDYCYNRRFNRCPVCQTQGKASLGKLRCAFKTFQGSESCGEARCWEHSFQWKVWGPQSSGITLCERHRAVISNANPADLLVTMLTVDPPQRHYSLNNIFRVRRILNRDRQQPASFEDLGYILRALASQSAQWEQPARNRYEKMVSAHEQAMQEIPQARQNLTTQIRQYYQQVNPLLNRQIVNLEIVDKLFGANKEARYEIALYLNVSKKGQYIGTNGSIIKPVEERCRVKINFWYTDGNQSRLL